MTPVKSAATVLAIAMLAWPGAGLSQNAADKEVRSTEEVEVPRSALLRTAIVVADADRSKRFYADVFAFEERFDGDITKPVNRELLGLAEGESARFVIMRGAASIGGFDLPTHAIGLLEISGTSPREPASLPRGSGLGPGQTMFAMVTDDMDYVIERLGAWAAPIVAGPVIAHDGSEIEIVTRDPDGMRIHVVQKRTLP
ncbi:VOC family protein [Altererythrobacter arenosus]|uniref:VOC family protein n=1 Tax=Altererythrobacter arenosus TaxID=3032592 RepID=A0ABY8FQE4_9SPHN|nr:VOC family protein [Altererythrobacter sp. CAU 1644]WFL76325.1 VOC family protein [Altererythrobacter sp. CAU 1644]